MGAMLVGMGVLHFVAPKPFDTIVPAELPGSARFYTFASGVAEAGDRRAAAGAADPAARCAGRGRAVHRRVPGQRQHGPVVVEQGLADARIGAIARLPLQIPMITQALKIYRNA